MFSPLGTSRRMRILLFVRVGVFNRRLELEQNPRWIGEGNEAYKEWLASEVRAMSPSPYSTTHAVRL